MNTSRNFFKVQKLFDSSLQVYGVIFRRNSFTPLNPSIILPSTHEQIVWIFVRMFVSLCKIPSSIQENVNLRKFFALIN